jgi:hypothetical protein
MPQANKYMVSHKLSCLEMNKKIKKPRKKCNVHMQYTTTSH